MSQSKIYNDIITLMQPTSTSQRIQINLERNTQKSAPKPQQPQQQMVPRQVAMSNNVSHVPPPQQQQAQQHFQQPPQQQQLNPLPVPVPVPSSAYMHLNPQQPQAAMPQPSSSGRTVTMMHQNPPQIPLDASDLLSPKLKKRRVSPSSSDDDSSSSSSSEEMRKLVRKLTKKKKKKDKKKKKKKSRKRSRSRDEYEDEDEDEEEDEEVEEEDEPDPRMDKIFREQQSKATTVFIDRDKVKRTVMVKDEDMEYFNKLRASKEHSVSRTDISPMRVKPLHHHRGGGGGDNNRDLSDGEIREGSRSPHHHNKPDFSSALSRPNQQPPPLKFDLSEIKKRVKSEEKEPRRARSVDSRSSRDSSYRDRKYYDRDGRRSPPSHGRRRRRSSDSRSSRSRSYSRSRSRSRSRSYDDGEDYCDDCHVPLNESNAYDHYNSKMHHMRIRNKIRCYLCSKYVDNPKMHLEHVHARDVFQCKGSRCTQPKFLDLVKILNHIDDKHPEEARMCSNNDDLIRRNMITIPQNLSSYKCKLCNRPFVGQPLKKVLQHQRWEDGQKEPDLRDIYYFCRICGGERSFTKDEHLQDHCKSHSKLAALAARSSPGSRPPPPVHRPRDGYYGGGGYYRRDSRDRGYGGGGRFRYDHRDRYRRASYSSSSRSRSRSPRSHREEGDRRSRVYVPCVFCPQVTENSDKDKKYHYDSNHRNQMFTCKPCKEHGSTIFRDIDRKVILEHIRRQHPDQPAEEEQVLKHSLVMPDDMKIIFCYACKNDAEEKKEEEVSFAFNVINLVCALICVKCYSKRAKRKKRNQSPSCGSVKTCSKWNLFYTNIGKSITKKFNRWAKLSVSDVAAAMSTSTLTSSSDASGRITWTTPTATLSTRGRPKTSNPAAAVAAGGLIAVVRAAVLAVEGDIPDPRAVPAAAVAPEGGGARIRSTTGAINKAHLRAICVITVAILCLPEKTERLTFAKNTFTSASLAKSARTIKPCSRNATVCWDTSRRSTAKKPPSTRPWSRPRTCGPCSAWCVKGRSTASARTRWRSISWPLIKDPRWTDSWIANAAFVCNPDSSTTTPNSSNISSINTGRMISRYKHTQTHRHKIHAVRHHMSSQTVSAGSLFYTPSKESSYYDHFCSSAHIDRYHHMFQTKCIFVECFFCQCSWSTKCDIIPD